MLHPLYLTKEKMARFLQDHDGDAEVSPRTVIHYRQVGLLDELVDEGARGRYTPRHLLQLRAARALRRVGKSIDEVRDLIGGRSDAELGDLCREALTTLRRLNQRVNGPPAGGGLASPSEVVQPQLPGGFPPSLVSPLARPDTATPSAVHESSAAYGLAAERTRPAPSLHPDWRVVPVLPGVWLLFTPEVSPGRERRLRQALAAADTNGQD